MFTLAATIWLSIALAPADTIYSLPEMTVTATRIEVGLDVLGYRMETIHRRQIERSGSRSAADVLTRNSSAYVRHYGAGGMASISLRGTGASQSSILLDGRRINDPQLGQIDLTLLPVDMISSVEVMYGAVSAVHGSDGIGGAVNLRTDDQVAGSSGRLRLGAGDFGERQVSGRLALGDRGAGVMLAGRLESARNDYPYYSRALGEEVRVDGAERDQASLFGSAHFRRGATSARISGLATHSQRGIPAGSGLESYERQLDESLRMWADMRHIVGNGYVKVGGLIQHSDIRYQNRLLQLDDLGRTLTMTADVEAGVSVRGWTMVGGSEFGRTTASHPSITLVSPERRVGLFAQGVGEIGRLHLYPNLRVDSYSTAGQSGIPVRTAVAPSIGANYVLTGRLHVRASGGRSFRMPTFNDRFWSPGGNAALRPERGWSTDVGAVYTAGASRADVSLFYLDTRDEIVWRPTSGTVWSPRNLTRTVSHGVEASVQTAILLSAGRIDAHATYRLADTRDRSDVQSPQYGMPLSYRPRHVGSGSLAWATDLLEVVLGMHVVGRTYIADDRSRWLAPYAPVYVGASTGRIVGSTRLALSARVENVLDAPYAVVENRPMPPRHFRISLQIEPSNR